MLQDHKDKNSWIVSSANEAEKKYIHHFFCSCGKEFRLKTNITEPEAPDILCPICGNDYFKDAVVFENIQGTKIWKYFKWLSFVSETKDSWEVNIKYDIPTHNEGDSKPKLNTKELLHIKLKKDGSKSFKILYKSKVLSQYSLFLDNKIQSFKNLLLYEAKEKLYKYIMANMPKSIEWLSLEDMTKLSIDEKLNTITFFIKNSHLKELRFYFWDMELLEHQTLNYPTQIDMLSYVAKNRTEKSIKKALYSAYEKSFKTIGGYHPYSDYVFSRTIENIDFLTKLYALHPRIKQHLLEKQTFGVAISLIRFLKKHYTDKQIVKLFIEDIQDVKEYKRRLDYWRDTLRMVRAKNFFEYLEEDFVKVKLSSQKLHDEVLRVHHLISYKLDSKEAFEYDQKYKLACCHYEGLEFKLPKTVNELSLWSKILHNCMFGYAKEIHQEISIIYGVFKNEELFYAVEIQNMKIVQAKSSSNKDISENDMEKIQRWHFATLSVKQ